MVNFLWENLFKKEEKEKDLVHLLGDNYLFENLTKNELQFLSRIVHVREYKPGETIFRQGEIGVGMYIIIKGDVDIHVESTPVEGESTSSPAPITQLEAGDFFGEISLVEENGRRTATALAATEASLIGFFQPDLNEVIERNPSTGVKILLKLSQVLGKRLKETASKISELKRELRLINR